MTSIAPLFVDHSDLATFSQAVNLNTDQLPAQQLDQQFWATPARDAGSLLQETLEITLTTARLVNSITFDTARFPHTIAVEYFTDQGTWAPLIDSSTAGPASVAVLQSVPARLPKATAVPGHLHPQHAYSGHWEPVSLTLRPTTVQRVRFVLQRSVLGNAPLDAFGNSVPYSLALANLVIGYRIASKSDVPRSALQPDSFTTRQSFATTDDLLGSSVDYSLRTNSAAQVVNNTDSQASLIWRCEPQPFPQAVVNFYADLRDIHGGGQVVDRIFIDPINNGAHISLYYCNDNPVGGFDPVNDPLTAAQGTLTGTAAVTNGVLHLGRYGENASVLIDNTAVGFDPSLPWWIGMRCRPNFNEGVDTTEHPLFDCGVFRVVLSPTGLQLITGAGDLLDLPMTWLGLNDLTLIASYDGINLRLRAVGELDDEEFSIPVSTAIAPSAIPLLTLGSNLAGTVFANVELADFVLKEELPPPGDDFLTSPDIYSTVAQFVTDDTPATRNALLRLDATSTMGSTTYPSALFGGPGAKYDEMVWTPIPRDYLMQRGWMYLPATKIKFIKLEITNLQAEYRDIYVPTAQLVKTFPPEVVQDYRNHLTERDRPVLPSDLGLITLANQSSSSPYADYPIYISTGGTTKGYTNTASYIADDYNTGSRLYESRGWTWGFQPLHSPTTAARWSRAAQHTYNVELISPNTKIAYVVGLRRIQFARTVFTGQDDAAQYEDMLLDQANILSSNWVFDPDFEALFSGDAAKAQATSAIFGSSRNMRGLQFAAQQSEPIQLLLDPDFADPQSRNWTFVGDAVKGASATLSPLVGTVLPVTRSIVVGYWGDVAPLYPTYGDAVAAGVTYGQMTSSVRIPQTEGGIASGVIGQPVGGRVYAAARVVASADLASPLWVQIIDSVTESVLSETSAVVRRDQVTEWYTAYTLGEGGVISQVSWGDLVGGNTTAYPALADSFSRPDASTLGTMDSGQQWITGANGSLTISSTQAKVAALGQADYVDTTSPWGSMVVKLGNAITTSVAANSVAMFELGGFQFMNDGRVINTAYTNATVPLFTPAAGDTLRFDFIPTKGVPIGQLPAGADPVLRPYALVIYRNNNWIATVLTGREFTTLRGLLGQLNQTYATFNWNPSYPELPTGLNVTHMPMPSDGALSSDGTYWTASDNSQWFISGAYTFTTGPAYLGGIPLATPSATGASQLTRDYLDTFGTFIVNVVQLASGVTTTAYMLAVLDYDINNEITTYLRADGAVVTMDVSGNVTLVKSGVVPGPTSGPISVRYVPTQILSSTFKTTYSVQPTDTKAMIFVQNGTVQGVISGSDTLWVSSVRGIASYNDGSGHFTTHEGMSWSPDASQLALDTRARSWGDVDQNNTLTWGDLVVSQAQNTNPIQVRVVQKAASGDTWYMDTLSLFSDPIVWEFSNDGGLYWSTALDIRNNPNGVLLFPPPAPGASNPNPPQNKLAWRVTSYGPNAWVSHLVIRPWYQGLTRGIPPRTAASQQGPNVNPFDHYPPIEQDPRFQVWDRPIPRSWWFAYRDHDPTHISDITTQWLQLLPGDAIVLPEAT